MIFSIPFQNTAVIIREFTGYIGSKNVPLRIITNRWTLMFLSNRTLIRLGNHNFLLLINSIFSVAIVVACVLGKVFSKNWGACWLDLAVPQCRANAIRTFGMRNFSSTTRLGLWCVVVSFCFKVVCIRDFTGYIGSKDVHQHMITNRWTLMCLSNRTLIFWTTVILCF